MRSQIPVTSLHIQQAIQYQKKVRNRKLIITAFLTLFAYLLIFAKKSISWQEFHIFIFDLALFLLFPILITIIIFTSTKDILASYPLEIIQLRYIQSKAARRTMLKVQPNPHTKTNLPLHYLTDLHSNQQQLQLRTHYHTTQAQKLPGHIFPIPTNKSLLPNFCYVCGKFNPPYQTICQKCHCTLLK